MPGRSEGRIKGKIGKEQARDRESKRPIGRAKVEEAEREGRNKDSKKKGKIVFASFIPTESRPALSTPQPSARLSGTGNIASS